MHQEPRDRIFLIAPVLYLAPGRHVREPHLLRIRTLEREFRRVLKDQNGTVSCADAQGRGSKMARQDLIFTDISV